MIFKSSIQRKEELIVELTEEINQLHGSMKFDNPLKNLSLDMIKENIIEYYNPMNHNALEDELDRNMKRDYQYILYLRDYGEGI